MLTLPDTSVRGFELIGWYTFLEHLAKGFTLVDSEIIVVICAATFESVRPLAVEISVILEHYTLWRLLATLRFFLFRFGEVRGKNRGIQLINITYRHDDEAKEAVCTASCVGTAANHAWHGARGCI